MTPKIVGVIFSRSDLRRAVRMRKPPDLFEVRLDRFAACLAEVRNAIPQLQTPLIITARHAAEGGANNLPAARRRALLLEFLPQARHVDVELRSAAALRSVLERAAAKRIGTIISFHDFRTTPPSAELARIADRAGSLGAAFLKVATRTDTRAQMDTLLEFAEKRRAARVAAMGIGKLGRTCRIEIARRGSPLNYGHLGKPNAPGQLSIHQLRRLLGF
jgi:3-dehydroquinate dehydratase-1